MISLHPKFLGKIIRPLLLNQGMPVDPEVVEDMQSIAKEIKRMAIDTEKDNIMEMGDLVTEILSTHKKIKDITEEEVEEYVDSLVYGEY